MLQVSGNTSLPTEAIKAYLGAIDNFDNLYIIQQGGRGITREQIIAQLERSIAKDAEGVYYANKQLWQKFRLRTPNELQKACKTLLTIIFG